MNDFPQRKRIRLKNYDYSQNGYYFVTICTYERQQLFEMSTVGRSLPEMIRWFKTMTTNDFIKSVNAGLFRPFNKKIWQKSYYEHVIRNDNDYALTLEYICNNPLKLELIRGNAAVN